LPRDGEPTRRSGPPLTAGYQLDQVRAAAREAGIDETFVQRALVERGHSATPARESVGVREGILPKRNLFLGAPATISFEAVVPGEMSERDFDVLVDTIRRTLNDAGIVSAIGRSLTWTSADKQRRGQITVLVRDGRTSIHVSERLRDLAGGLFGGIMGGGSGVTIGPGIALAVEALHMPFLIAPFILAGTALTYTIARQIFTRIRRSRSDVLQRLTERMAQEARESIARRTVGAGHRGDRKMVR